MKTHTSIDIASYIIKKADEQENTLTPMQVIKLVYLCHGWMLALNNRPLISEPIEAWQYGPVIRDLYEKVKGFGSSPIPCALFTSAANQSESFSQEEIDLMDEVMDKYSGFSGIALSRMTHAPDTPWSNTWLVNKRNAIISNDLIEDHFKLLYNKHYQQTA